MDTVSLSTNSIAFIALCNEYCATLEQASSMDKIEFINAVTRLLPRIYISASDINTDSNIYEASTLPAALDEEYYDSVRRSIENLLGPDDTYLEVFEDDMKYSDTPIATSISENLTDIFQSCYNFVEAIKDAPEPIASEVIFNMKEDFINYWSAILCNVMRPLNQIKYLPDNQY